MIIANESTSIADEVRAAFAEEAAELSRRIERSLSGISGADEATRATLWLDVLRALHTLKGAASAGGALEIRDEAHSLEDLIRALHAIGEPASPELLDRIFGSMEKIGRALSRFPFDGADSTTAARHPTDTPSPPPTQRTIEKEAARSSNELIRVRKEHVESLHHLLGDLVLGHLQQEELARNLISFRDRFAEASSALEVLDAELGEVVTALPPESAQRIATQRRTLATSLGALRRELTKMGQEAAMLGAEGAAVSTNLADAISDLRLAPLAPFFEDFTKVAREAARECEKQVVVRIRAEGAEVDRSVLAELREPLFHLVRNAVVHGIEAPAERLRRGKPELGTVLLEARCEGSRAVLRITDDGAGIDPQRVLVRAKQLGLVDPKAESGSVALLDILTQPGFSSRDEVCTLAGRGIGLDVVANRVDELSGRLRLDNLPGAGCSFTLEVPIRAAASRGLVVGLAGHRFGLLLSHVDRVLRIDADDIELIGQRESVAIDSEPIAVESLASLLGLEDSPPASGKSPAVLLRFGRQRLCVYVDEIWDEQSLVIKAFGRAFQNATVFAGGAVQPDGSVVPVLHVPVLLEKAARSSSARKERPQRPTPVKERTPSVLAVDDSMTMRTLLRNLLRASGYEVVVARDGQAAMAELARMDGCDLVVTDLEMPTMDGLSLCRAIRGSEKYRHLPVVVVTSRGEAEEKRRALEAGADAYVVKAEFEQVAFLDVVKRLLGEVRAI